MYEIVNVQYTGTYNNVGTSIPAVLGEFRASSAADLPAQNVDCHIICGCDGLDIATGDKYIWNGTAWVLQPSANAWQNVYTKSEIDSMTTEIYGIIAYYHTTLVSATGEISFYSLGGNVRTWAIYGNGQQTGTPTPDNPVMPDFVGKKVGADWTIPISCAGQTTPVYLGQTQTVRRIKKLVFTGNEDWVYIASEALPYFRIQIGNVNTVIQNMIISTHLPQVEITTLTIAVGVDIRNISSQNAAFINLRASELGADVPSCKAYLAAQYAAGTPVTVWYVLATPETEIVNEPLAKIGAYADELPSTDAAVTIPTAKGSNTLTVDTNLQPSLIEISGGITHE